MSGAPHAPKSLAAGQGITNHPAPLANDVIRPGTAPPAIAIGSVVLHDGVCHQLHLDGAPPAPYRNPNHQANKNQGTPQNQQCQVVIQAIP